MIVSTSFVQYQNPYKGNLVLCQAPAYDQWRHSVEPQGSGEQHPMVDGIGAC